MSSVVRADEIVVVRDGRSILGPLSWQISEGERWVVLGPNGAGKSTLFQLLAAQGHPSSGKVSILECELGKVDIFELRPRIGFVSSTLVEQVPEGEKVLDLVMTAAYAIVGRWQEEYDLWDESRAISLLTILGVRDLRERIFSTLSEGEKKRVLIARALMPNPELLLLDEPASGLDLGGREDLLIRLRELAQDPTSPATVIITHHVEEIPQGTTHILLLKDGEIVAIGPIAEVLTSAHLENTYGIELSLSMEDGRYTAKAVH
jgi:iron complex transport system ATP-binding protein